VFDKERELTKKAKYQKKRKGWIAEDASSFPKIFRSQYEQCPSGIVFFAQTGSSGIIRKKKELRNVRIARCR